MVEVVFAEDFAVGQKFDVGAIGLVGGLALFLLDEVAARENGFGVFAVAVGADGELGRERVDGLGADAVEANRKLEDIVVVFGAGVDDGDALDDFAQRDAATVVADGDAVFIYVDVDLLAVAHDEFVDGVVDDFLEQDIDAVVGVGAGAEATDVHAGAQADVL